MTVFEDWLSYGLCLFGVGMLFCVCVPPLVRMVGGAFRAYKAHKPLATANAKQRAATNSTERSSLVLPPEIARLSKLERRRRMLEEVAAPCDSFDEL